MLTVTDIFAGAGGSSTGMIAVPGVQVRMAANHSELAVRVHNANHPDTDHACVDLHLEDPRNFPRTDMLWASPECFAAGTLILTERGLIPIEDVTVGDRVLTHAGRYREVTATMSKRADTVRLIGQGHSRGLEVTAEHPILTTTGAGVMTWTNAGEIATDGRERWATPVEHPASPIPPISGARPIHVEDLRFAWLVGRWLGDGSLRVRDGKSSEAFITCGKHEAGELEKELSWVHHDCGTCAPELTWARRELRTAFIFANSHSEFARWLREHFGQHSHGKTVPTWALGAPLEWRRALLDGYLSADGHDDGRAVQAASVSKRLALGIRLLAESLGHRASLTYHHRDTWRIEGRSGRARPQWTVRWLHEFKRESQQTAAVFDGKSWGVVKAVEPATSDVQVYDLTVAEDHSYVADGIVVHNCTKWSIANNRARALSVEMGGDPSLFDDVPDDLQTDTTDEATRSRLLMFDVLRFVEHHRYRALIVENVVDIASQAKYRRAWEAWQRGLRKLGYSYRVVSLNSMHAQAGGLPAPQSRDRLYVVAWPDAERGPEIERALRPAAWCPFCSAVVESRQAWKNGRTVGRYRTQYVYCCGRCGATVEPGWLPAAAAIDWTLPGQRIGDRAKPLAEKTRARIAAGIARYWRAPFVTQFRERVRDFDPLAEPLRTIVADGASHALAVPLEGRDGKRAQPAWMPARTQTARHETALVLPAGGTWNDDARPTSDPYRAFTTREAYALVQPFIAELRGGSSDARRVLDPLCTVTASGNHHALVAPYYGSSDYAKPVTDPIGTLTTVDRYALLMRNNTPRGDAGQMLTPAYEAMRTLTTTGHQSLVTPGDLEAARAEVDDCLFRMLEPHEVAAGMAFPGDYKWEGNRRQRVKLMGNAVTPPAARDLMATVVESLDGAA